MKQKIFIAFIVAIVMVTIFAVPKDALAYATSGTIDAPRYSNGNMIKYIYINGANVSLYYINGNDGFHYAYPITTPSMIGAGDTASGCPIRWWDWGTGYIGDFAGCGTIYPRVGDGASNSYSNWGPVYSLTGIGNDKVEVACALILMNGYPLSGKYTGYGIDWQHAQYATNVALQNLSAMCYNKGENSSYSPTSGNAGTAAFCYDIGQIARQYLANSYPKALIPTPASQNAVNNGSFYNATITVSLPSVIGPVNRASFYTNSYSLDLSGFPSGTTVTGYSGTLDSNGNQTVSLSIPILGNGAKTFTGRVVGTYINRTAAVSIYDCGWSVAQYNRQLVGDERTAIYTNNIATPTATFIVTTPSKADLVVSKITTDKNKYNVGDTATITATVQNAGATASIACIGRITYDSSKLTAVDMSDKVIPPLAPGATTALTFQCKPVLAAANSNVPVTVIADATNLVDESSETNNSSTAYINVNAALPDFSCDFVVYDYAAGQDADVTVTVKNTGNIDNPNVPVRLTVGNTSYDTTIPVPIGSNLAVFRVTMPNISGQITITATVDPDNTIAEYNENNNTATHTAQVSQLKVPQQIDALDSGLEKTYLSKNKQIPNTPDNPDSMTHTWQEYRYEGGSYVLHTYTATLSVAFAVKPDSRVASGSSVQSGFGIEQTANAILTTNYDHPEKLVGVQDVWLTYPETYYGLDTGNYSGYYETMTSGAGGALSNSWSYPPNPYSVGNMPLHYIPLWFPDGQYTAFCTMFGAWSPNGKMYADLPGSVTVSGNMYDRITAVGY